jgi:hypothetical protein
MRKSFDYLIFFESHFIDATTDYAQAEIPNFRLYLQEILNFLVFD